MKVKKLSFLSLFLIIGLLLFIPNTVNAASTINEVILDSDGADSVEEFEITIETDENVMTIGQDGPLVGPKGYNRNLVIVLKEGYKIASVKVNGVEQTLPLENNELSFNNIQEDINIVVKTVKQINFIWNTDNQEFIKGTDKNLLFILDNNRGYGKVFVDGVELSETDGDYLWEFFEGIYPAIKLSEEYMKTLELGKHTIKFIVDNVGEAETTFTIIDPNQTDSKDDEIEDNNPDNTTGSTAPDIETNPDNATGSTAPDIGPNPDNATGSTAPDIETNPDNATGSTAPDRETSTTNNPPTGDNILVFVGILGLSVIGILATTKFRKNK